ncbi:MAG: transposase, partial [Planctomycetes bacterium]|nr:transposase [Planctomycetota bacterium]
ALNKENIVLKAENQKLKDEINRLKGEKGKPDIKPKANQDKDTIDKKRKPKKKWKKQSKLDKVKIDETETIRYDGELPEDAQHKGYRSVVVQNIIIKTNNIEYQLERYYSASEKKTYEASLPEHVEGEFGADLKSWVLFWYFHSRMSEEKIYQMLTDIGISISEGKISNIITTNHEGFKEEKAAIIEAGINSTTYQHIDDSGARVNGTNQYFTVLCNDYYSAFFIKPKKDRLTVMEILSYKEELSYMINAYALTFLEERQVPASVLSPLYSFLEMQPMKRKEFEKQLEQHITDLKVRYKNLILEAAAIAAYQEQHSGAIIECLVCDDAKQFHSITTLRALCWIHEERHYCKLTPFLSHHQKLVDDFRSQIWDYYFKLKEYKNNPNEEDKVKLSMMFDEIFSTKTGYEELDKRIKLTRAKKDNLLLVLDHPEVPLHNNPAELAVRAYIIKRKISNGTRTNEGTKSWETFFTIMDTCRKLGVNFRDYLYDRLSKNYILPSLASLIPKPT